MKTNQTGLAKFLGDAGSIMKNTPGIPGGMEWLNNINTTVNNITNLIKVIQDTQGMIGFKMAANNDTHLRKGQVEVDNPPGATPPAHQLPPQQNVNTVVNGRVRDILTVADRALNMVQQQGKGDIPIGKVITELPFTVDQVDSFLKNMIKNL